MANGRTVHSLDIAVAATDAMPARPVLPLPLRAAAVSALLHGGLIAALVLLLGGGGAVGMPGEDNVVFVALATASDGAGAAAAPQPIQDQPGDPPSDPLQAAMPPEPSEDALPLKFEKLQAPPPKPPQKPSVKPAAKPVPVKAQAPVAVAANADQSGAGTLAIPGSGAGSQLASLTPGPVGAFNGMALAARFRTPPTPPPYPRRAEALYQQGVVMVRALIDERGRAQDIRVYASSGYPLLDRAALEAVAQWDFLPAMQDGRPVAAWVEMPVRFALN